MGVFTFDPQGVFKRRLGVFKCQKGVFKWASGGVQTPSRGCNCINEYHFSQKSRYLFWYLLFCAHSFPYSNFHIDKTGDMGENLGRRFSCSVRIKKGGTISKTEFIRESDPGCIERLKVYEADFDFGAGVGAGVIAGQL